MPSIGIVEIPAVSDSFMNDYFSGRLPISRALKKRTLK
jgi:hypothetical protein